MDKLQLQGELKNKSTAYLWFFLFGAHYAYLNKWGMQFLFWFTLGGFGLWGLIDLFSMGGKVRKHNNAIYRKIDALEKEQRKQDREDLITILNK